VLEQDKGCQQMKLRQWFRPFGSEPWSGWPERAYGQERYQQRLFVVKEHLAECLNIAPHGQVRITSLCAGDGRDVIGVLASHQRRNDVAACLVELNRQSVAVGLRLTKSAGLEKIVDFRNEDATVYTTYKNSPRSDIVLVCGVWAHVPVHERGQLVDAIACLCKPGGTVIWTRGVSKGMTRLHEIESLFTGAYWNKVRISLTPNKNWAVASYRYSGPPKELSRCERIFHFTRSAG
jgi:Putative methyltransferase